MVIVLESTLEWTLGEVIVNSGIGSHIPCFSLDSASGLFLSRYYEKHFRANDVKKKPLAICNSGLLTEARIKR